MDKILWIALAFLAGAFLPVQGGLNAKIGKAIASPVYASMISFVVGMVSIALYILFTRQPVSWEGWKSVPAYTWLSGALGAFYVTVTILAFPRIGPALTFGLVVGGQMLIAVLMDHFNILTAQPHPINLGRIIGVLCVVIGVILIRRF